MCGRSRIDTEIVFVVVGGAINDDDDKHHRNFWELIAEVQVH
jgi:hypothetical protein